MKGDQNLAKERHLVVVGAGTMGVDIAAAFLSSGWHVSLVEPVIEKHQEAKKRFIRSLSMLRPVQDGQSPNFVASLQEVQFKQGQHSLVIEAVPEVLALKQSVFAELVAVTPEDVPLCSNSSAIPISAIGRGLSAGHRMVGTHFFMPAHLVPGVEVVSSQVTDPAMAERVADDLRSAGRVPIRVKRDIPGFLVNRLQHALSREAFHLIDEGIATPADIDAAVRFGFGFRYLAAGPCLQRDHAGLDIHYAAGCSIYPDLHNGTEPGQSLKAEVDAGHYGMKVGRGFYEWNQQSIQAERQRYEDLLLAAARLLKAEIAHAQESASGVREDKIRIG